MNDTPAEIAGGQVAAVVEGALAAAEVSVADANARAEAAREAAALVTEAAIERVISERVDNCEEGIEQCENENQALSQRVTALQAEVTTLQQSLTTLITVEMLTSELAKLSPQPSIPRQSNSPSETTLPSNPDAVGDGPPDLAENQPIPKKHRIT